MHETGLSASVLASGGLTDTRRLGQQGGKILQTEGLCTVVTFSATGSSKRVCIPTHTKAKEGQTVPRGSCLASTASHSPTASLPDSVF